MKYKLRSIHIDLHENLMKSFNSIQLHRYAFALQVKSKGNRDLPTPSNNSYTTLIYEHYTHRGNYNLKPRVRHAKEI